VSAPTIDTDLPAGWFGPSTDTLFHVYGLSVGGEVLSLGDWTGGIVALDCLGMAAVKDAIASTRHGWDVAGPWEETEHDAPGFDELGAPLVHTVALPSLLKVHAFRVVDVDAQTEELWVNTADGPMPLSQLW
jgi:hypothetical protein